AVGAGSPGCARLRHTSTAVRKLFDGPPPKRPRPRERESAPMLCMHWRNAVLLCRAAELAVAAEPTVTAAGCGVWAEWREPAAPGRRDASEDAPGRAGPKRSRLAADREGHRALEQHADLLVRVGVLGNDGAGVELQHAQGDALAVDRAPDDPIPDPLGAERADVGEGAHRIFTLPIERRL